MNEEFILKDEIISLLNDFDMVTPRRKALVLGFLITKEFEKIKDDDMKKALVDTLRSYIND